jgi:hypothetical protein
MNERSKRALKRKNERLDSAPVMIEAEANWNPATRTSAIQISPVDRSARVGPFQRR